jgi:hypothetical protein
LSLHEGVGDLKIQELEILCIDATALIINEQWSITAQHFGLLPQCDTRTESEGINLRPPFVNEMYLTD